MVAGIVYHKLYLYLNPGHIHINVELEFARLSG